MAIKHFQSRSSWTFTLFYTRAPRFGGILSPSLRLTEQVFQTIGSRGSRLRCSIRIPSDHNPSVDLFLSSGWWCLPRAAHHLLLQSSACHCRQTTRQSSYSSNQVLLQAREGSQRDEVQREKWGACLYGHDCSLHTFYTCAFGIAVSPAPGSSTMIAGV